MGSYTYTSPVNWKFKENYVEPTALNDHGAGNYGNYISSESALLLAGPAKLTQRNASTGAIATLEDLVGIGLVEGFQVSQQKDTRQLWEIGSRNSYFFPGRTIVQAQLNRVLFNGNNLMGAVYSGSAGDGRAITTDSVPDSPSGSLSQGADGTFSVDLSSSYFNKPFGLGLAFRDSEDELVQIMYLENCNIMSYVLGLQAQQLMVVDNLALRCSRCVPVLYDKTA